MKKLKYKKLINIKNPIKHHLLFMKIFECLIEKIDGFKINPENQFKTKVSEHILSDFLRSTISSFESIEN